MVYSNISGTTRLTEAQARTLADWLGGRYQQAISPESPGEACHGVVFEPLGRQDLATSVSHHMTVFSLEQAQALENLRDAVNPGAPDWVG